jgi:hypothetical protein
MTYAVPIELLTESRYSRTASTSNSALRANSTRFVGSGMQHGRWLHRLLCCKGMPVVSSECAPAPAPDLSILYFIAGLVGNVVWPGFYIICVEAAATTASLNEVSATDFVFSDGSRLPGPSAGSDTEALTAYLEGSVLSHLGAQGLRSDDPTQGDPTIVRSRFDWSQYRLGSKLFTTDGQPVDSAEGLATLSTVYLFEVGRLCDVYVWRWLCVCVCVSVCMSIGLSICPPGCVTGWMAVCL